MTPAQEFYAEQDRANARFFAHLARCRDDDDIETMKEVCFEDRKRRYSARYETDRILAQHARASKGDSLMSGLEQFNVKHDDCCDSCDPKVSKDCIRMIHRCFPHGELQEQCSSCQPCPDRKGSVHRASEVRSPFRTGLDLYGEQQAAGSRQ